MRLGGRLSAVVSACLLVASCGFAFLGPSDTRQDLDQDIAAQEAEVAKLQAQLDDATGKPEPMQAKASKALASKPPAIAAKPQTEAERLQALNNGLKTIHNLRNMFKKDKEESPVRGAEKFANGAMSEELSNQDSQVWSTIESMLGATQKVQASMKGKSKSERDQLMASLEGELDKKAGVLSNVTTQVSKKQQQQDEEYLLGLLLMHRKDWTMEKQLHATQTFMKNSPIVRDLFAHHDATKPLAPQLAVLLDAASTAASKNKAPSKGNVAAKVEKQKASKAGVKKAASAAARALFIELASSVMNKDCPYCVAQCVDKCHGEDAKPYTECLTVCADAGK